MQLPGIGLTIRPLHAVELVPNTDKHLGGKLRGASWLLHKQIFWGG
jgi:hypothetical protein